MIFLNFYFLKKIRMVKKLKKKKQNQKKTIESRKQQVAELYDNVCYVCNSKFSRYFVFHHKRYHDKELTYRDFKSSIDYNNYILKIVKKRPDDFALLCRKHHRTVEILKQFSPYRFERVVRLVRESR